MDSGQTKTSLNIDMSTYQNLKKTFVSFGVFSKTLSRPPAGVSAGMHLDLPMSPTAGTSTLNYVIGVNSTLIDTPKRLWIV
jgi:hypothetical protein